MGLYARRALGLSLAFLILCFAGFAAVASAAGFGVAPDGFSVRMLDSAGMPEVRAGSHPDRLQIDFAIETGDTSTRDLAIEMPPGFAGDPGAVPTCPRQAHEEGAECPSASQVGLVTFGSPGTPLPIYVLEPEADQVAAFTSKVGLPIPFQMELRPSDFGVTFSAEDLAEAAPSEGHVELWGTPADHQEAPTAPSQPFLTAPSICGSLTFTLRMRSREADATWQSASAQTAPLSGCADLHFAPSLRFALDNPVADSPTGMRMELSTPVASDAEGRAEAQIKDATIELPAGIGISPSAVGSLTACSDAQLAVDEGSDAHCPPSSKIGSATFDSPLVAEPLSGEVYIGTEAPGERFRLFVVVPGPGVTVKFVSALHPDPVTGRLAAALTDLPQVPIRRLTLVLAGGASSLIASPLECGAVTAKAGFVPYGGAAAVNSASSVAISPRPPATDCSPAPFAPRLEAKVSNPNAGRTTSFSTALIRADGEQLPRRFALTLPAGMNAGLGAIEECPAAGALGPCPAGSRIGSVRILAGYGPEPLALGGGVFITGPYRGAPFGLLMQVRAAVGQFDLGTLSFQSKASLDPASGRATVTTDQLPQASEGVPIRFREIDISMDRPGLVRNPTSCRDAVLDARLESSTGTTRSISSPLSLRGCRRLRFRPRFLIALRGSKRLVRGARPGMLVRTRPRPVEANLRSMRMALPPAFGFALGGLGQICSRVDARHGRCPANSRVGAAVARTPLLSEPLQGGVYVTSPKDNGGLPELSLALAANGVSLNATGRALLDHGRFVTVISDLADVPLRSFEMRLRGGSHGVLALRADLCGGDGRRLKAELDARGQNGARLSEEVPIGAGGRCGSKGGGHHG